MFELSQLDLWLKLLARRYTLRFAGNGNIAGKGPEGCTVEGKFYWNHKIYKPSILAEALSVSRRGVSLCNHCVV